jgi:hypothetical protein
LVEAHLLDGDAAQKQRCADGGQARHIPLGYGTIILSRHTTGEMLDFK